MISHEFVNAAICPFIFMSHHLPGVLGLSASLASPSSSRPPWSPDSHLPRSSVDSESLPGPLSPLRSWAISLTSPAPPACTLGSRPLPPIPKYRQLGLWGSVLFLPGFPQTANRPRLHLTQVSVQMFLYSLTTLCKDVGMSHFSIQVYFFFFIF